MLCNVKIGACFGNQFIVLHTTVACYTVALSRIVEHMCTTAACTIVAMRNTVNIIDVVFFTESGAIGFLFSSVLLCVIRVCVADYDALYVARVVGLRLSVPRHACRT
jgi:hypothetical protein